MTFGAGVYPRPAFEVVARPGRGSADGSERPRHQPAEHQPGGERRLHGADAGRGARLPRSRLAHEPAGVRRRAERRSLLQGREWEGRGAEGRGEEGREGRGADAG